MMSKNFILSILAVLLLASSAVSGETIRGAIQKQYQQQERELAVDDPEFPLARDQTAGWWEDTADGVLAFWASVLDFTRDNDEEGGTVGREEAVSTVAPSSSSTFDATLESSIMETADSTADATFARYI